MDMCKKVRFRFTESVSSDIEDIGKDAAVCIWCKVGELDGTTTFRELMNSKKIKPIHGVGNDKAREMKIDCKSNTYRLAGRICKGGVLYFCLAFQKKTDNTIPKSILKQIKKRIKQIEC